MTDGRSILVPIDGSTVATRALDFAIERAKVEGAKITVAFALNRLSVEVSVALPYVVSDPTPILNALDVEANAILEAGESRVREAGVPSRRALLDGIAAQAILAFARESKADAIVMGTHGRSGFARLELGGTAEDVIRSADIPVMVVPQRAGALPKGALSHVLIATDGSPAADRAVTFACELAVLENAHLSICCVAEPVHTRWSDRDGDVFLAADVETHAKHVLEKNREQASSVGLNVDVQLLRGDAIAEILSTAPSTSADLIVVGTHGRAGIPRFILGSVAEGVLRSSTIPVCAIRAR